MCIIIIIIIIILDPHDLIDGCSSPSEPGLIDVEEVIGFDVSCQPRGFCLF